MDAVRASRCPSAGPEASSSAGKTLVALASRRDVDQTLAGDEVDDSLMHIIEAQSDGPIASSIAIHKSKDVHFGNKTYIHGPVTIQQFISEVRVKEEQAADEAAFDNKAYEATGGDADVNAAATVVNNNVECRQRVRKKRVRGKKSHRLISNVPYNPPREDNRIDPLYIVAILVSIVVIVNCLFLLLYNFEDSSQSNWSWTRNIVFRSTIAFVIIVMLIALTTYLIKIADTSTNNNQSNEDLSNNSPIKTEIDKVLLISRHVRLISRLEWLAQPSGPVDKFKQLPSLIIITHTATEPCTDQASCTFQMRTMQTFHIESRSWSDIGYNFAVGGDGAVYEGRGWDTVGAHTKGYNAFSLGIALIGTFNSVAPNERQLVATQKLIELGLAKKKIDENYKLMGHRQLIPTLSPGDVLFNIIKGWPHFAEDL